jgi:YHS domain-containing protein
VGKKKEFADYQGFRIHFCCHVCKAKFWKDPGKYVKAMTDQGIALEKAPETGDAAGPVATAAFAPVSKKSGRIVRVPWAGKAQ